MTLNLFARAFPGREVTSLTRHEVREWRNGLPVQPSTANKYNDRVKSLYHCMIREEQAVTNPADLDPLDEPAARRVRLEPQILPALLGAARHPRDRALIAVAVELLLRGGELAELRVSDVLPGALRVMVEKQKGELTEDEMAISGDLELVLRDWLAYYRQAAGLLAPDAYLFPRLSVQRHGSGTEYSVRPTERIGKPEAVVKLALANAGFDVPAGTGVHAIRRTCARLLFDHLVRDAGVDRALSHVSSLMHHSSRATTELYLGQTGDRVLRNQLVRSGAPTPLALAMAHVDERDDPVSSTARVYPLHRNRV